MPISALKQYQRPRGTGRFADLSPDQRALAESHHARLCAKWGDDLPQWRRAILVGRAKDLVLRPRDADWGRALRKGRERQPTASPVSPSAPRQRTPSAAISAQRPSARPLPLTQVASSSSADAENMASPRAPANMASPTAQAHGAPSDLPAHVASSLPVPSTLTPPSPHAVRLDIRGITASGRDGADSARRILHDLELRAFDQHPHFSIAVPGADLPPGWAWRLVVAPVS